MSRTYSWSCSNLRRSSSCRSCSARASSSCCCRDEIRRGPSRAAAFFFSRASRASRASTASTRLRIAALSPASPPLFFSVLASACHSAAVAPAATSHEKPAGGFPRCARAASTGFPGASR